MKRPRILAAAALAFAACAVIFASSVFVGTETLDLGQAWAELRAGTPLNEAPTLSVLLRHRVPRTLAAFIAGAGLALAGCAFQALLRNPLATPYTLGVASAGALGAWIAFLLADVTADLPVINVLASKQVMAFLFAGLDVFLVYLLAARHIRTSPAVLLLAGVTLGMLANAGILFSRFIARPDRLVNMDRWLMGGVDVLGYQPVILLAAGVIPCAVVLLLQAARYDQFAFGTALAAGRGVNVSRLQITTFVVGSLITAVIVSEVGPIGFVGLIIPHGVRLIAGPSHRYVMPLSIVAGGAFLCACDIIARRILPGETPIGIITTLIGGPVFLYLLVRRQFSGWQL
ncbi:MAG: iron ABC transporter permease [Candidatus Hydrogenedentes bacterium]|nr:iron ABC transporter permease [Candidatus Hydrogenedentota bacterium]